LSRWPREFDPFRLVKEPDQATPKLLLAVVGSEVHSAGDVTVAGGVLESVELVYTKITLGDELMP
jgi:hypothetical protein